MTQQPHRLRSLALAALLLAAAGVLVAVAVRTGHRPRASEYQAFESPDGRFRVVVYSFPSPAPMMPGQGGDARGFVRLYDRSGRLLREEPVDRVQRISSLRWENGRLEIPFFAVWDLPPPPTALP